MRSFNPSSNTIVITVLISHILLSGLYAISVPIFEAYDESGHYAYARYIAINRRLPPMRTVGQASVFSALSDESAQPPGYYLYAAIPLFFIDVSDDLQPKLTAGGPTKLLPILQAEAFPSQNTALAVRIMRLMSIPLGTFAVLLTYLTALNLFPSSAKIALIATAIHAWWPQFISMNSTITNDIGVALGASGVYWLSSKIWRTQSANIKSARLPLLIVALAIGSLATMGIKGTGIALIIYSFLFILLYLAHLRRHSRCKWRGLMGLFGVYCLTFLLCFGLAWLFARGIITGVFNRLLFNMGTGQAVLAFNSTALAGFGAQFWAGLTLSLTHWTATFKGAFAAFSWGGLGFDTRWYRFAILGIALAVVGVGLGLTKKQQRWQIAGLGLAIAAFVGVGFGWLLRFVNTPEAFNEIPGRYLVPSIGAFSILVSVGLNNAPRQYRQAVSTYGLGGLALIALAVPFVLFIPTYRPPERIDPTQLNLQYRSDLTFGNAIRLLGYNITPKSIWNNCENITLYWQSHANIALDYGLLIESTQSNSHTLALRTPVHGTAPTSIWQQGEVYQDTHCLTLPPDIKSIQIAWVPYTPNHPTQLLRQGAIFLKPTCNGQPCEAKIEIR